MEGLPSLGTFPSEAKRLTPRQVLAPKHVQQEYDGGIGGCRRGLSTLSSLRFVGDECGWQSIVC